MICLNGHFGYWISSQPLASTVFLPPVLPSMEQTTCFCAYFHTFLLSSDLSSHMPSESLRPGNFISKSSRPQIKLVEFLVAGLDFSCCPNPGSLLLLVDCRLSLIPTKCPQYIFLPHFLFCFLALHTSLRPQFPG